MKKVFFVNVLLISFVFVTFSWADYKAIYQQGDKEKALTEFIKEVENELKKPLKMSLFIYLKYFGFIGKIYENKDYDFGISFCDKCVNEQQPEKYVNKCNVKFGIKNTIESYCLRSKAIFHARKGEYEKAIKSYDDAVTLSPKHPWNYHVFSLFLSTIDNEKGRDGNKALELAKKSYELFPDHNSLNAMASAYAELGDFNLAIEKQNEAIAKIKKRKLKIGDTTDYVSSLYPEIGNYVDSEGDLSKMIELYDKRLQSYQNNKPWRMSISK